MQIGIRSRSFQARRCFHTANQVSEDNKISGNTTSRQDPQLKGGWSCQQIFCTIEDCYKALLRYRFSRMDDDGTRSHLAAKGGGHAAATLKAALSRYDHAVGKTHAASGLEYLGTNLHRRGKKREDSSQKRLSKPCIQPASKSYTTSSAHLRRIQSPRPPQTSS